MQSSTEWYIKDTSKRGTFINGVPAQPLEWAKLYASSKVLLLASCHRIRLHRSTGDIISLGKPDAKFYAFRFTTSVATVVHGPQLSSVSNPTTHLAPCPLCDTTPTDPVCMPCSHVLCWACAVSHFQKFVPGNAGYQAARTVCCPACDVEFLPPGTRLSFQTTESSGAAVPVGLVCRPVYTVGKPPSSEKKSREHARICTAAGAPPRALACTELFAAHVHLPPPALCSAASTSAVAGAKRMRSGLDNSARSGQASPQKSQRRGVQQVEVGVAVNSVHSPGSDAATSEDESASARSASVDSRADDN